MNSLHNLFTKGNTLNEKFYSLLVFLLVASVFLFPMFLGKVDTPIDIRNVQMYPWRYYAIDQKVEKSNLWEYNSSGGSGFEITAPPISKNQITFKLNISEKDLDKVDKEGKNNYYLSFNYKIINDKLNSPQSTIFSVCIASDIGRNCITQPVQISKTLKDKNDIWLEAYLPLSKELENIGDIENLKFSSLLIESYNKSKNISSTLYVKDLKLICENFSRASTIHNPYNNDLIQGFTPNREHYSNAIKKGRIPFWYHYLLTGIENITDPQVGYFHPFYFLAYLVFDHFTAHLVVTFVCFILCGFGAFILGRFWGLGFWASLFTGLVYMFHPFNVVWFSFEHILMNSATLPFLLLTYEKNLRDNRLINPFLLLCALLQGLIFLSGHLQISYYTTIFFVLFAGFRFAKSLLSSEKNHIKHVFSIFFIFLIALMMGSIVFVPFIPFVQDSYRVLWSKRMIMESSIPLKAFLGLLDPYYMGTSINTSEEPPYGWSFARNYVYFGLLPFLFSLFTLKVALKNKYVLFFYFIIVFSILIFTGSFFFFFIRDLVPGFKQLQHHRFIELYSYCVPFLAGIGFQVFLNTIPSHKKKLMIVSAAIVFLISAVDLFYYSSYFLTWSNRKEYKPLPKGGSLEFIKNEQKKSREPFRVLSSTKYEPGKIKLDVAQPNTLVPYEIEDVIGYSSFIPKDIYSIFIYIQTKDPDKLYTEEVIKLFSNPNIPYPIYNFQSKLLDLLNVKYFLVPNSLKLKSNDVKKVFSGDCAIYENLNFLPRAFIVSKYKIIESPKETIVRLDDQNFNSLRETILASLPKLYKEKITLLNKNNTELNYNLKFLKYEHEKIILQVNVNRPAILIFGSNFNHNWRVMVNGKQSELFQANLVQKGVYLPSTGKYTVEYYYYPKLFLIGFLISFIGVVILILLGCFLLRKRKNSVNFK